MERYANYVNRKINRLLVVERFLNYKNNTTYYKCKCDCGNEVMISQPQLSRKPMSCGCYRKETTSKSFKKHGYSREKLYLVWKSIKKRCYCKTDKSYKYYGANGISVCDEWKNDYVAFRNWAYENGYKETKEYTHYTIDRISPFGNYEPSNCRICDWVVQRHNRRENYE